MHTFDKKSLKILNSLIEQEEEYVIIFRSKRTRKLRIHFICTDAFKEDMKKAMNMHKV